MSLRLLTVAQAAELLGASPRTLRRRIAAGTLPVFRDGGLVRVPERALLEYVERRTLLPAARPNVTLPAAPAEDRPAFRVRRLRDMPDPLP